MDDKFIDNINNKPTTDNLLKNTEKIHTTKLGDKRIKHNLGLTSENTVEYCKQLISKAEIITRKGKNWYVCKANIIITINAHSFTIITAHKNKDNL
jgi:hypothetical protein